MVCWQVAFFYQWLTSIFSANGLTRWLAITYMNKLITDLFFYIIIQFGWDSSSSEKPDSDGVSRSKPTSGLSERQRSSTNLSESSVLKAGKMKPGTPTAYKCK